MLPTKKKSQNGQEDPPVIMIPASSDMSEEDQVLLSRVRDYEQSMEDVAWDLTQDQLLDSFPTNEVPEEQVWGLEDSTCPTPAPINYSVVNLSKVREERSQLPIGCFSLQGACSNEWDTEDSDGAGASSDAKSADSFHTMTDTADMARPPKFRWVVPADGEVKLKVRFQPKALGHYMETLHFELVGTQKSYAVECSGVRCRPTIATDYRTIFAHAKIVPCVEDGLKKTYVIKPGYFEFGPLLCNKTRDGFKQKKILDNVQSLVFHNNSLLKAEVRFLFEKDPTATPFLLDPPTMTLEPDKAKELLVWAYPTSVGRVEDRLMCLVKDNCEYMAIHLACTGVIPKLEMDTKHIQFEWVLKHRPESRTLTLHNRTAISVAWHFKGVEELGVEFTLSHVKGIILPNSSFCVIVHFKALTLFPMHKTIHLEVSDTEDIPGNVTKECLLIETKVHDVSVKITFPETHNDTSLDFGTIHICEENRQRIELTNNGKFEIQYKFLLQRTLQCHLDPALLFTISPQQGTLKPTLSNNVYVEFRLNKEICIKQQPILKCQIMDPGIGEIFKEMVINVSLRSLFTRYSITPDKLIDFGLMKCGSKSSQTFTIKNEGEFKTNYQIVCHASLLESDVTRLSSDGRSCKQKSSLQRSLDTGIFTVSPSSGTIVPGTEEVITVGCQTQQLGSFKECLLVDISGRDPTDQPGGMAYYLLADVCLPEIGLDYASIFEDHFVCNNKRELMSEPYCGAEGVFIREDKTFVFNRVCVGGVGRAHFKITNVSKLPCVFKLSILCDSDEKTFMVFPDKFSIDGQSHSFAEVTFKPLALQLYHAVFEASLYDTPSILSMVEKKDLQIHLAGEGILPQVTVVRPALFNNQMNPLLAFGSLLVGRKHTLPLVLSNQGNVLARVYIAVEDTQGVFTLKAAAGNACSVQAEHLGGVARSGLKAEIGHFVLEAGQQVGYEVSFSSQVPLNAIGKIMIDVEGNPYKTIVQLLGEAYQGIITLDHISRPSQLEQESDCKALDFGHCHMGTQHKEHFILTNHSKGSTLRFEWPSTCPQVSFSPKVGHLHAGCAKKVTVTFYSKKPVTLSGNPIKCQVCQVEFQQMLVANWDDSPCVFWWPPTSAQKSDSKKVLRTRAEPAYSVVAGSQKAVELRIYAVCDYAVFSCSPEPICFKDTMLFYNRVHRLDLINKGNVKLEYTWNVLMDPVSDDMSHQNGDVTPSSRPVSRASRTLVSSERPSSALATIAARVLGDPEKVPFRVEPSMGILEPTTTLTCKVHFTPRKVARYRGSLTCSIPNLQDGVQSPCISVCGTSLLPACHFMLEESDYLTRSCCSAEHATLDPSTRVVEFSSIGCSILTTRRFHVLNPTRKACSFQWECVEQSPGRFRCITPNATILPGKQQEVCFHYVATKPGVEESLWSFHSKAPPLSIPFLLVGNCREPHLYLDKTLLNIGDKHIGSRVEETVHLVNAEEQPYSFVVLISGDQHNSLQVVPTKGIVSPKERLSLSFGLTLTSEGPVTFNSVLKVKGKMEQLSLKVKAVGFKKPVKAAASLQKNMPRKSVKVDFAVTGHVELDRDTLAFGAVSQGAKATQTLNIANTGQLMARCCWDVKAFPRGLSIVPNQAHIHPGKETAFNLSYVPVDTSPPAYSMDDSISCYINKSSSALTVNVTGFCIPPSAKKEVVDYLCAVRSTQVKGLAITNSSKECWTLKPLIEGEYWSATPTLVVEPSETATYNVTYRPLTMAPENKKHLGSVCVSCPDGTVWLYVLQGAAAPPTAEDKLSYTVPSKTPNTHTLDICNWLPKPQRFTVLLEILDLPTTDAVSLKGLEHIDVPASKTAKYQICFNTYREGKFNAKATFCNKESGEYLFYLLHFTASASVLPSVAMKTFVRQPVWSCVEVENPLATPVSLTAECTSANITIPLQQTVPERSKVGSILRCLSGPDHFDKVLTHTDWLPGTSSVTPQGKRACQATITFMYQPLHAGTATNHLTLCSKELGNFQYDLHLTALPARPESTLEFKAFLGCSHTLHAMFTSYCSTTYTFQVDSPEFTVSLPPNNSSSKEMCVKVCFEPHQLGIVEDHLKLFSLEGGEYIFPLHGTCAPPKCHGPITVTTVCSTSIPFKNVFLHNATFSYQVDNPCFTVEGKATVKSKETVNLKVWFNATSEHAEQKTFGKLLISTPLFTGHKPFILVYYLIGTKA